MGANFHGFCRVITNDVNLLLKIFSMKLDLQRIVEFIFV